MESVKTIRAVERAFDVLRALQGMSNGATLIELKDATGLSGPTLLRMLKTLIAAGVVRRSMTDQRYRNSVQLQVLAEGISPCDRFADVAAPWLDQLCQKVEWPSDLMIHLGNDDFMSVLESNLRQARFYVRRRPGRLRVNLLASAAGSAFLAALTVKRRHALVRSAREGRDIHNAKVIAINDTELRVAQARQLGYSTRHPAYIGGSYNGLARDDSLQAIAVPVVAKGHVLGALNINWNRAAIPENEMVGRYLSALRYAAEGIAKAAVEAGLISDLPCLELADPGSFR